MHARPDAADRSVPLLINTKLRPGARLFVLTTFIGRISGIRLKEQI